MQECNDTPNSKEVNSKYTATNSLFLSMAYIDKHHESNLFSPCMQNYVGWLIFEHKNFDDFVEDHGTLKISVLTKHWFTLKNLSTK